MTATEQTATTTKSGYTVHQTWVSRRRIIVASNSRIRAGRVANIYMESGDWFIVDVGFSSRNPTCAFAVGMEPPRGCRQNGGRVVNCWKWGECGRWGYDGSAPAPRYDRCGLGAVEAAFARGRGQEGPTGPEPAPCHDTGTTGGLSTPCAGYCTPALLGEICPRTTEIGRTLTAASAAGGTGACGPDCWRR